MVLYRTVYGCEAHNPIDNVDDSSVYTITFFLDIMTSVELFKYEMQITFIGQVTQKVSKNNPTV